MHFFSQRFRKYFENVSWLIFEKGFTLLVGMVVGIYVARYLKPESFGLLNYAISFVSIFSAFSTLGMDQIIVRELAKQSGKHSDLLGTGFILKLAGSLILIVMMMVILLFMHHDPFTNTLIMIIAAAEIFKGFEVISYFFQAQVLSKYVVQVQLLINLLVSLIKLALVFIHAPLIWFAIVIVFGSIFNAVGFIYAYHKREGTPWKWDFHKILAYQLLRESWPIALYGIALHIQARIDQVMLGKMLNNTEVGQYSVALKFIEIFGFMPMILMNTFAPAVTKAKAISEELYHNRLINLYRLMFVAFLLISIPIYLFSEKLIALLYGLEYQSAGYLLSLFALRLFFSNMGVGKSVFIINESLFKYSLFTVIIGAATNITFNYFLIPRYASVGSIIASMISFTVSIFLVDLFFQKTRENQWLMFKGMFSFWRLKEIL
ncbi:MAG TPA: flippase [Cyclobacteriaceae bacterium]|jgi:O-antigen/teichoic acid export membrane protein|nr:flippase [Cyclobacteriaceae bacterium]